MCCKPTWIICNIVVPKQTISVIVICQEFFLEMALKAAEIEASLVGFEKLTLFSWFIMLTEQRGPLKKSLDILVESFGILFKFLITGMSPYKFITLPCQAHCSSARFRDVFLLLLFARANHQWPLKSN